MPADPRHHEDASRHDAPTSGAPPPSPPPELDGALEERFGAQIGAYRVLERIGEGGFGSVFLADQERPVRRRVALKIIKLGMDTRQVIARFEAERQALAIMDHPNIARVLDAGATATGRPYFVMELVKGVPITRYCDQANLGIPQRLELFRQVCHAVQHAHTKGIIHRDLKPSNILVATHDDRPAPKIIDFGIAKATSSRLTDKTIYTEQRVLIGTPEYMSPEQADLETRDIDTRSDIYSLGVILYELLTGVTPFDAARLRSGAQADIQRIIRDQTPDRPSTRLATLAQTARAGPRPARTADGGSPDPPPPAQARAESTTRLHEIASHRQTDPHALRRLLRGDLDWVVMKALEKERSRRYETANALALDIDRFMRGQPVLAAPPSAAYAVRKFVRRHRAPVIAAGVVALVLVAGAAVATAGFISAVRSRDAEALAKHNEQHQRVLAEQSRAEAELQRNEAVRQRDAAEAARAAEGRQRALAEANQKTAEAINAFLVKMLGSADIREAGRNATVAQALDRAAESVSESFEGRPEVEASVRSILASTYLSLSMPDKAEPHVRAAVELNTRLHGPDHLDTIEAVSHQAFLHHLRGDYRAGIGLLRDLAQRAPRVLGPEHSKTLGILGDLANDLRILEQFDEAEAIYRGVLDARRRNPGLSNRDMMITLNSLAVLLHDRKRLDEAEPLYEEAADLSEAAFGPEHPDTLTPRHNLASIAASRGEFERAEAMFLELLPPFRKVFGDNHEKTARALWALGNLYKDRGRYRDALPYFRENLQIHRQSQGQRTEDVAACNAAIADCLSRTGDDAGAAAMYREAYETRLLLHGADDERTVGSLINLAVSFGRTGSSPGEAEALHRKAVAEAARALGKEHPRYVNAVTGLGVFLHAQKRLEEAEAAYREGLEIGRRVNGENDPDTAISLYNLMGVVNDRGDLEEARALAAESLERFEQVFGPDHPNTGAACAVYADVCCKQKDYDAAEPLYLRSIDIRRRRLGAQSPMVARALGDLGAMRLDAGDPAGAEPLLREAVEIKAGAPPTPASLASLARSRGRLGECLARLARYDQAEPLLLDAFEALARASGESHQDTRDAAAHVADLYAAWDGAAPGTGKAEKAAQWRAKAAEQQKQE